jgi:hypothetical protein
MRQDYDFLDSESGAVDCELALHCTGYDLLFGQVVFAACFSPVPLQADMFALYAIQDFKSMHEAKRHAKYSLIRRLNHRLLGYFL